MGRAKRARTRVGEAQPIHVGQPFDAPSKHGLLMACGRQTKTDISQITESLQTERRMALSKSQRPASKGSFGRSGEVVAKWWWSSDAVGPDSHGQTHQTLVWEFTHLIAWREK